MTTQNQLLSIKTMNSGIRFILQVGITDSNVIDYQIEMINQNAKDILIPIEKAMVGENIQLHYDITGLQSLGEYLSKNTLNKKLLIGLLDNICDTLMQWDSYFLNKNNYLLDMSYIFSDIKTGKIKMIYIAIEDDLDVDINKSFKTLLKEIVVDYAILEDTALDDYLYKLLNITKEPDFNIETFRDKAQKILLEKPAVKSIEKKKQEPVVIKEEKVEQEIEQEFKMVYKDSTKLVGGITQMVFGVIYIVMVLFLPSLNIKMMFVAGGIGVLAIVNILVMLLIFSSKNKIQVPVKPMVQKATKSQVQQKQPKQQNDVKKINNVSPPSVNLSKREIVTQLSYDTEVLDSSVPYLVLNQGGTVDKIFINKDEFKLGRLEKVNDYVVAAQPIGKEHAKIVKIGLDCYIVDLESRNGTFVNGNKLVSGEEVLLTDGDDVRLANIKFKFKVM